MSHPHRELDGGLTHHVTAHALPKAVAYADPADRHHFRQILFELAAKVPLDIHAYALMGTHVHLLATVREAGLLARAMNLMLSRYTLDRNRAIGRQGPLWLDRYANVVVCEEEHVINSYLYIDANPWRAGLVDHPRDSDWTSYRALTEAGRDRLLTPHPVFLGLGADETRRQAVYARLMDHYLRVAERLVSRGRKPPGPDPLSGLRLVQYSSRDVDGGVL